MNKKRDLLIGADHGLKVALETLQGGLNLQSILSSFSNVYRRSLAEAILKNIESEPGITIEKLTKNIHVDRQDLWDELNNLIKKGVVIENESNQLKIKYPPR